MESNEPQKIKKQTVRLEENFYKEVSIKLIKEGLSFQKLIEEYLKEWVKK